MQMITKGFSKRKQNHGKQLITVAFFNEEEKNITD